MQLLGGRGYIEPSLVPQLLRDARLIRIFEGPTEALTMALGTYVTRDASALLQFVDSHLPRGGVANRLRALLAPYGSNGRALHAWTVYQLGDLAACALLLAATHQRTDSGASMDAVRWLDRLLTEKDATLAARSFHDIAPASAHDLGERVAQYARSIGDGAQTLAGEDHQPDPLLSGVPRPMAQPVARKAFRRLRIRSSWGCAVSCRRCSGSGPRSSTPTGRSSTTVSIRWPWSRCSSMWSRRSGTRSRRRPSSIS
jgi:hypothetical protein